MPRALVALLARRLGLDRQEATALLAAARARLGSRSLTVRMLAFTVAASRPAVLLPASLRRRAVAGLVGPLLETPAALNAYAARRPLPAADPCAGLVRDA